ncbi:MAG: hypothetical protein L3J34_12410 [Flavobacteriaceae bacterium]|nr:hypothetical protein [Flavobacteriaceae bacterium]
MIKYYRIIEVVYLIVAIVFMVEAFINWSVDPQKAYIYLAFSLLAVFMYFFRKKFRKKFENKKNNK